MSEAMELQKLVKQLQTTSNNEDVIAILRTLRKDFKVNEAILRESKAGLAVGKLRIHASKDVSDLAKEIVKQWRNEVENAKAAAGGAGKPVVGVNTARKASVASNGPATSSGPSANAHTMKSDGVPTAFAGDKTWDKSIELVYDSIASDSGARWSPFFSPPEMHSKRRLAFDLLLNKAKAIGSLFVNLEDKNNPSLRETVANSDIQ
ncbi:hypothetical protein B0H12DRAFT_1026347, partial [Mycena haematopus]